MAGLPLAASLFGVVVMWLLMDPVLIYLRGEWAEVVCLWTMAMLGVALDSLNL